MVSPVRSYDREGSPG